MSRTLSIDGLAGLLIVLTACGGTPGGAPADSQAAPAPLAVIDWSRVDSAIGRAGAEQPGGVHRYGLARSDLKVTAGGVPIRPAFALGAWVAFKAVSDGAVAMGDLVLTESELGPVMKRLQEGGVEQTAIHHHLIRESPRVLYMHIHAHGDAVAIAGTVHAAVALTGTPASSPAPASPPPFDLDTAAIGSALGRAGRVNGGVLQFSVPRSETIRSGDFEVPASMGVATAINFEPAGAGKAAITGDFVMLGSEVNPVIRALEANGIEPVSLHSHMLDEQPRLFFMHFWAVDDPVKLARGLRAALDATGSRAAGG